jgi:hypothetical protein
MQNSRQDELRFERIDDVFISQLAARANLLRKRGLTAVAFQTPMATEKSVITEKNVVTCCRTITSNQPRWWEIWSSGGSRIDLVAVTTQGDLNYYAERVRSNFKGTQYSHHAHRTEDRPGTDVRRLIPPFLQRGQYFKVLNCREQRPFQAFEDLNFEDDSLYHLLNALQSLSTPEQPVHAWVAVGWRAYDWSRWAGIYGQIRQPRTHEMLRGREPGQHTITIQETLTTPEKEAATKVLEAAREPNICAVIRIALFSPSRQALMQGIDKLRAALLSFRGKKGGCLLLDPAPFEVDVGKTVDDIEALFMMTSRDMGTDPARLIQRYVTNLKRGFDETIASEEFPIPYLLMNSNELGLFVHLPVRAGERNLPSIEWTRTAFSAMVEYPEPPSELAINIGVRYQDRHPFCIDQNQLMLHTYLLGKTQAGKSTLICHIALNLVTLMANGKFNGSIFLVDPHGDLSERLKEKLPKEALDYTLFFNPVTEKWGMNLLALPKYDNETERDQRVTAMQDNFSRITRETVKGIAGSESWGPRLASIISEMQGALYYSRDPKDPVKPWDAPTIRELVDLISAVGDKEDLAKKLAELGLPEYLQDEVYATFKDMPNEAKQAVFTKLRWFLRRFIRPFTCSHGNNLDFAELVKPNHIVIFSFKGLEADDTIKSVLMASIIMKLYAAVLQEKGPVPVDERWPTLLIVDEFQRAVGVAAFEEIVTQAAKYKLALCLAHQSLGQITREQGRDTILGNMHTFFVFTPGSSDAGDIARELDLQFSSEIAEGLNALPAYNAYVKISSKGMDEQRPPIRIIVHPPSLFPDQRTLEEANEYFATKMAPYKPEYDESFYKRQHGGAPEGGNKCMTLWNEHSGRIPPPSTYPTLFAIRDFVIAGFETAKATERPITEVGVWPTHPQLVDFIQQNRTQYAYLTEITRGRLHDAIEKLKSAGFIKESLENWTYIISDAGPERTKRLQSLVLFEVSAGTTVTGGGEVHRSITFSFLQDFVRQKAYLPKYPEQTEALPDGILVPPKGKSDEWDFNHQVAVECEIDADRHWDRVLSNIQRDFNMNYHSIIIVTNTKGGKASVEEHLRETDAIPEHMKQRIQVVLFELRVPIFRR